MRLHFSTDDVPLGDREQFCRDVFATQVMRVTPSDRPDLGRFRAHLDAQVVGRFILIDFQTPHRTGGRTAADARQDNSDRFQLRRVRCEEIYTAAPTRSRSEELRLAPGDFYVSSCEWPYEWETQDGTSASGLVIPRAVLSPLIAGGRLTGPVVIPARSPLGTLVEAAFGAVNTQAPLLPPALGDAVLQNLSRLVALACGTSEEGRWSGSDALRVARLEAAKRHIEQHLDEPDLTPAHIAAALGISVRTLHLAFEPTGTSFAEHVTRRRLQECRSALERPTATRSITDVAFAWGFSNLTTFYRAFHREFGMAPGQLRPLAA
jgi:AraC-like DNA-binding protein